MRDFRKLKVWEKGHKLALDIYGVTKGFPREERYGLTDQIRRAASSVPTNIAEGCGRGGDGELSRFLTIAAGSASEVEYQLLLSSDLGYLKRDEYRKLEKDVNEIKKMLGALIRKTKS